MRTSSIRSILAAALAAAALLGAALIYPSLAGAGVPPVYTLAIDSISSPVEPGSSSLARIKFNATAAGSTSVKLSLLDAGSNGTLSDPTTDGPITNCVNTTPAVITCDYNPTEEGITGMTVKINVSPNTPAPTSFTFRAAVTDQSEELPLDIIPAATTTVVTTTTVPEATTSVAPATTQPSKVPVSVTG